MRPITRHELKVECIQGGREELERLSEEVLGPRAPGQGAELDAAWKLLRKKFQEPSGAEDEGAADEGEAEDGLEEEGVEEEDTSAATADAEAQHGLDGGEGEGEDRGEPAVLAPLPVGLQRLLCYVESRLEASHFCAWLQAWGVESVFYHAGMPNFG